MLGLGTIAALADGSLSLREMGKSVQKKQLGHVFITH